MRALRLTERGAPLEERDVEVPEPGPGEVLVRVRAAGICHSDVHYRAGTSWAGPLPLTPGHEVAGEVVAAGAGVDAPSTGERVALHYLLTCGACPRCAAGAEQFCPEARMLGKSCDGGFAELVCMPARNAVPLPAAVSFSHGAVLMCGAATAYHALRKARFREGERVAVFGAGGVGSCVVQLAGLLGAGEVFAVDVDPGRLEAAGEAGARPVPAGREEEPPEEALRRLTGGDGVDVAVETAGLPETTRAGLRALAPMGRLAVVGIHDASVELWPYREVIGPEAEIIGVSDHLLTELPRLLAWARDGALRMDRVVRGSVPLEADAVNRVLDRLEAGRGEIRTVIVPGR